MDALDRDARGPPEAALATSDETFIALSPHRGLVKVIIRIDAAPGFEDGLAAAIQQMEGVFKIVEDKARNFDFVAGIEAEDANAIRDIENAIRHESGVQGVSRVEAPDDALLARLRPG